jgi:beta-1,4-mannosyl-glycoprotein beta-1,4-N-acetylglucosaminyltransferase
MIYEIFMFNDELDLLEIKLAELYDFVDKFILIEATHTHSNIPKPLWYTLNEERFARYKDKIINMVCNFNQTDLYKSQYEKYKCRKEINDIWFREHFQRDFAVISNQVQFADDDIIIVSDVDELVNKHTLKRHIDEVGINGITRLEMQHYIYNFNLRIVFPTIWRHTYVAKYEHLKPFDGMLSYIRHSYKFTNPEYFEILVNNMGWHFSYLMTPECIVNNKFKSFAHADDDFIKQITVDTINNDIKNLKFFHYTLEEAPIAELPKTVQEYYKYSKYFWGK